MFLIISLTLNVIFPVLFVYIWIKTNRNKLLAQIEFLKTQLKIVQKHKSNKKYRSTIYQKMTMAVIFMALKQPVKLCYIFKPERILSWYRNIVKKLLTFPSVKHNTGRHPIPQETIDQILRFKRKNPHWGCRSISNELKKLDISVCKSTVASILIKHGLDPTDYGLTWSAFLKAHINSIFAFDFKIVTTLTGVRLYVLFFISHYTRKIVHFNVTQHPNKNWIENQLRNFVYDFDHRVYLIRDNDELFHYADFEKFNIEDVPICIKTPDMNAVIERFIGSFNREALNHFVIFNQNQLFNIAKEYVTYYNNYRPHQGIGNITIPQYLNKDVKELNAFNKSPKGEILKKEFLGGLLNHYYYKNTA